MSVSGEGVQCNGRQSIITASDRLTGKCNCQPCSCYLGSSFYLWRHIPVESLREVERERERVYNKRAACKWENKLTWSDKFITDFIYLLVKDVFFVSLTWYGISLNIVSLQWESRRWCCHKEKTTKNRIAVTSHHILWGGKGGQNITILSHVLGHRVHSVCDRCTCVWHTQRFVDDRRCCMWHHHSHREDGTFLSTHATHTDKWVLVHNNDCDIHSSACNHTAFSCTLLHWIYAKIVHTENIHDDPLPCWLLKAKLRAQCNAHAPICSQTDHVRGCGLPESQ